MSTWNGSSACDSEIFSIAGSSIPVIASARLRMTGSTGAATDVRATRLRARGAVDCCFTIPL